MDDHSDNPYKSPESLTDLAGRSDSEPMDRQEAERVLAGQTITYNYPKWLIHLNTLGIVLHGAIVIGAVSFMIAVGTGATMAGVRDLSLLQLSLGTACIVTLSCACLVWALRTRHHCHAQIVIDSGGVRCLYRRKSDIFAPWLEIGSLRRNLLRDEIRIFSAQGKKLIRIDRTLIHFDQAMKLIRAMTSEG